MKGKEWTNIEENVRNGVTRDWNANGRNFQKFWCRMIKFSIFLCIENISLFRNGNVMVGCGGRKKEWKWVLILNEPKTDYCLKERSSFFLKNILKYFI